MKKNILNYISTLSILVLIFSCSTEDKVVDNVFDGVTNGAVLRTVEIISSDLALGDDTGNFSIHIEEQDNQGGDLLSMVKVYASFADNTDDGIDNSVSESLFQTLSAADFTEGPFGLPRATITLLATDMLNTFGLVSADTNGGDQFQIRLELELTDGRIFSDYNAGSIVTGGFFASPFFYNGNITCPFTTSFAETFSYTSYAMGAGDGSGGQQTSGAGPVDGTVTWTEAFDEDGLLIEGVYDNPDFSFGMFAFVWGDSPATSVTAQVKWFCSSLLPQGADQYSDSYTYNITNVDGDTMTIEWNNTWGDIGTVDLTREGNEEWPSIFGN
jgi:hypothetical protein